MRALVDFSHLGRSKAPGRNERRPERELKRELLLKPLGALRQGQEQFLRLGQVGDRFWIRRAPHRVLRRRLEIGDCGFPKIRAGVVVSDKLWLGFAISGNRSVSVSAILR